MHDQKPLISGENSQRTIILLHGRGSNAADILQFAEQYLPPSKLIALQADNNQWYPFSFLMPKEKNEPYLSAALKAIDRTIKQTKLPLEQIYILGFSQGACLATEYITQNPNQYGGIFVCSGALIGEKIIPTKSSLKATPVFFGCSQNDPFIPLSRIKETINYFKAHKAKVTEHIYPGHSHTISEAEIKIINSLILKNQK